MIGTYRRKTEFIKSFVFLKYQIERGFVEADLGNAGERVLRRRRVTERRKDTLIESIKSVEHELRRMLDGDEIEKLKMLDIPAPPGSIIFLPPFLHVPIVGFNLDGVHELFQHPGWLFHATTDEGLRMVAGDGHLLSPVEQIFRKKNYLSEKFESTPVNRVSFGISFAFQDAKRYQEYINRNEERTNELLGFGGFFIFPLGAVLRKGQTLWFGGIDGYPEIDLIDNRHFKKIISNILELLVYLKQDFDTLLNNLSEAIAFRKQCVENIDVIRKLAEVERTGELIHCSMEGDLIYFFTESNDVPVYDHVEKEELGIKLMERERGTEKTQKFMRNYNYHCRKEPRGGNCIKLYEILSGYADRALIEVIQRHAICGGKGEFFETLRSLKPHSFSPLLESIDNNDLFRFILIYNRFISDYSQISPTFSVPPKNYDPYLRGTIFHNGIYFFVNLKQALENLHNSKESPRCGMFLMAQIGKRIKNINKPMILAEVRKLTFRKIKELIRETRRSAIESIGKLIPYSRTEHPLEVDVRKGVLFLTKNWYHDKRNKGIFEQLINAGVPMLMGFEREQISMVPTTDEYPVHEIEGVIHEIFGCDDLELENLRMGESGFILDESRRLVYYTGGGHNVLYQV